MVKSSSRSLFDMFNNQNEYILSLTDPRYTTIPPQTGEIPYRSAAIKKKKNLISCLQCCGNWLNAVKYSLYISAGSSCQRPCGEMNHCTTTFARDHFHTQVYTSRLIETTDPSKWIQMININTMPPERERDGNTPLTLHASQPTLNLGLNNIWNLSPFALACQVCLLNSLK